MRFFFFTLKVSSAQMSINIVLFKKYLKFILYLCYKCRQCILIISIFSPSPLSAFSSMPTPTSSPLKNKKQRSLSPVSAVSILVSVGLSTGAWSTCHVPTHPTHFSSSSSHQLPIAHQLWILHYVSLCFVYAGMLMGLVLFVKAALAVLRS